MHLIRFLAMTFLAFACAVSSAQVNPIVVSVDDLTKNPRRFDGQLVRVNARLEFGWEGDNFLFDPTATSQGGRSPARRTSVWLYCKPGNDRLVWGAIGEGILFVEGTFTGYFHFVPRKEGRIKDVFDPGPFQLEAIYVSGVKSHR